MKRTLNVGGRPDPTGFILDTSNRIMDAQVLVQKTWVALMETQRRLHEMQPLLRSQAS